MPPEAGTLCGGALGKKRLRVILRNGSGETRTVVVGLVADPGLSAQIAGRLVDELPEMLARHVSDQVSWQVRVRSEAVPLDEHGEIPLIEYAQAKMPWEEWDLMVLLTDLPRRVDTHVIIGDFSAAYGAAQISLPAIGWLRPGADARDTVVYFVDQITSGWSLKQGRPEADSFPYLKHRLTGRASAVRRLPSTREGVDAYLVLVGVLGKARLLFGTVRNNRPWRLMAGLSGATAAGMAGGAFGIFFSNVWSLADTLPTARHALITVLAVTAMVLWLIAKHDLWERPASRIAQEQAVLYNIATVITLFLGVAIMYLTLFAVILIGASAVIAPDYLQQTLGHPVGAVDYAAVAWLSSSMGTVAGALGAGLESEHAVRRATYSRRERERREVLHRQEEAAAGDTPADSEDEAE